MQNVIRVTVYWQSKVHPCAFNEKRRKTAPPVGVQAHEKIIWRLIDVSTISVFLNQMAFTLHNIRILCDIKLKGPSLDMWRKGRQLFAEP